MRLVYGDGVTDFVRRRVIESKYEDFGPCQSIGVADHEIIAGVVYSRHNPRVGDIHLTIAADSPRWAKRGIIRALFHYPYEQLDCHRTTVLVRNSNERSLKLAKGLGYEVEGVIRYGFGDEDMIILGMLRTDCKWL